MKTKFLVAAALIASGAAASAALYTFDLVSTSAACVTSTCLSPDVFQGYAGGPNGSGSINSPLSFNPFVPLEPLPETGVYDFMLPTSVFERSFAPWGTVSIGRLSASTNATASYWTMGTFKGTFVDGDLVGLNAGASLYDTGGVTFTGLLQIQGTTWSYIEQGIYSGLPDGHWAYATSGVVEFHTIPIPEPATYALMAGGLVVLAARRRRTRSAS